MAKGGVGKKLGIKLSKFGFYLLPASQYRSNYLSVCICMLGGVEVYDRMGLEGEQAEKTSPNLKSVSKK